MREWAERTIDALDRKRRRRSYQARSKHFWTFALSFYSELISILVSSHSYLQPMFENSLGATRVTHTGVTIYCKIGKKIGEYSGRNFFVHLYVLYSIFRYSANFYVWYMFFIFIRHFCVKKLGMSMLMLCIYVLPLIQELASLLNGCK